LPASTSGKDVRSASLVIGSGMEDVDLMLRKL
jgi:hypothetical protein